jgi:ATP-binding cassette subfamily B protein
VEEEVQGKIYDWRLMRRLARYARPYWVIIAISVGLMLAGSLLQVAGPLITKLAVDRFLAPAGVEPPAVLARWLSADPWTGLTQLSILYLTALALGLLFDFGQTYLMQWTGQRAMFDLRRELMDHLSART